MEKMKVLNKKEITSLLNEGNIIRYDTIIGKVYVCYVNRKIFGAVRFDTYIKMSKEIKRFKSDWMSDYYKKGE